MQPQDVYRRQLIRQLQGACSGELAAGHAYRGHWRSLSDESQRQRVQTIEAEEWHHREIVLQLLRDLGAGPSVIREGIFWLIGKSIGLFCLAGGWFLPMYGAGRLERSNIAEYEVAAEYAVLCGRTDMVECLLTMAEVEWEHEQYFRSVIGAHPRWGRATLWDAPPPKASIRTRYRALEERRAAVA